MKAIIHYADGTSAVVGTDGTWLQSQATSWVTGQAMRSGSGAGYIEKIDARNLMPTWFMPGFNDSAWTAPTVIGTQPNSTWTGTLLPDLTRIVETVITPVSVTRPERQQLRGGYGQGLFRRADHPFSGGASGTTISMLRRLRAPCLGRH